MGWRDELQPARFRNAAFHIEASDMAGGRRLVVHEYPQQDIPFVEDLGRKAEEIRVTAFVLGDDYKVARDALIAALREHGPGILVHPLHGQVSVVVQSWSQRESTREGGIARFEISFVESGEQQFPRPGYDTQARVAVASDVAFEATTIELADQLDTRGPGFLVESAVSALGEALDHLGTMTSALSPDVAAMRAFELTGLSGSLPELVTDGVVLARRLGEVFLGLRGLAPGQRISGFRGLVQYGSGLAGVSASQPLDGYAWRTASRRQEASNNLALAEAIRRFALIESARAGSEFTFATYDDAIQWRTEISDRLDAATETSRSDAIFAALRDLRIETVRDIDHRAVNMPMLRQVQPGEVVPAAVLAYRLYGDATRGEEIARRNGVRHPGFVPPQPLSVPNR